MISLINRIGNEHIEPLSTIDSVRFNVLYHAEKVLQSMNQSLKRLETPGVVEHIGRNTYVLERGLYAAVGEFEVHTLMVGFNRETNKSLLLKRVCENGSEGTLCRELQRGAAAK